MYNRLKNFYDCYRNSVNTAIKKILLTSIIVGAILFACEYAFIISLQGFIASLEITTPEKLNLPLNYPKDLGGCLLIFLFIGLLKVFFQSVKIFSSNYASQLFAKSQREEITKLSLYYYPNTSMHEVISLFTDVLGRASTAVMEVNGLIVALTTTLILIITGFKLAPYEMLVGMGLMSTLIIPLKLFNYSSHLTGNQINEYWKTINKKLLEGMRHNFFIKIHGRVDEYKELIFNDLIGYKKLYTRYFIFTGIKNGLPIVFGLIIICAISFLSKTFFHTEPGKLLAFLYLFIRCAQGASEVSSSINSINVNYPGLVELNNLKFKLQKLNSIHNSPTTLKNSYEKVVTLNQIELRNVQFHYREGEPLFKDLSFKLNRSDVLLIKGASGTGKSTIISLLTGMLIPVSGKILINEKELKNINLPYDLISYVGPEPFIFEDTLKNNLLVGHPRKDTITDAEILDGMQAASFDNVFNTNIKDLNLMLNETTQLSTGQKQRLSLARAILRHPQLLILDESTANLDSENEQIILNNLKNFFPQMITIIIGHKSKFETVATKKIDLSSSNQEMQ
jgi:ATP-binding cassette subfamily B protein